MLSPCLLLSLLFTVARSYSTSRHSGDVRLNPTCEQLREFWDEIGEMAQAAEITNEIPILPLRVQNAMDLMTMAPFRNNLPGKSYKKMIKDKSPYFLDITNPFLRSSTPEQLPSSLNNFILSNKQQQQQQQAPSSEELNGVFGGFHKQVADELGSSKQRQATKSSDHHYINPEVLQLESSLGVGNNKNTEIDYFIPQWGLPEEAGTFGSFVDIDFASPYLPMTRTPKGIKGQWSDISHEESPQACDNVMNLDCRTNEDCFCKGWRKLICVSGKCLGHEDAGAKYGTWHDRPIPHSQLQLLARQQKRSYKSIFM